MSERDALKRLLDEKAGPEAQARLRARLEAGRSAAPLLKKLPGPQAGAAARVRARLAQPRPSRVWIGGVAMAAAALVALGVGLWPSEPAPLQQELAAAGELQASDTLRLRWQGQGALSGDEAAPRVQWDKGALHLDLEPDQGVDLQVRTREASVAVLGTVFDVERDALGTRVSVERGKVRVDCERGADPVLTAGQSHTCAPVSAAAMVGRLKALGPVARAQIDAEVQGALELPDAHGAVRSELLALRLEAAFRDQDWAAVQRDALAYLEIGGPRQAEIREIAVQLAGREGDCAQVRTLTRHVDNPSAVEQSEINACEG